MLLEWQWRDSIEGELTGGRFTVETPYFKALVRPARPDRWEWHAASRFSMGDREGSGLSASHEGAAAAARDWILRQVPGLDLKQVNGSSWGKANGWRGGAETR